MRITTRECSLGKVRPELIEMIKGHLTNDDKILICCETKCDYDWYHVYAVTQHKIVFAGCGYSFWGRPRYQRTSYMQLVDIVSINEQDPGRDKGYIVQIRGHGEKSFMALWFESRQASLKFTSILCKAIEQAKTTKFQGISDIADQLAKLAKLYQVDRAITKEEYEAAKRKLLG